MGERVILFGNGQIASVAYAYLTHDSEHEVVAFTVDRAYRDAPTLFGLPVVPFEEVQDHFPPDQCKMLVSISYRAVNRLRAEKYREAKGKGYGCISYIHSRAVTWPDLQLGENCFILEQNVIQPFVTIGADVTLWSGNHIGHHTVIGDHCFIASQAVISGYVTVEPSCFVGVNATIRDGIRIGAECVIGAGALILKDTAPKGVYVGAPGTRLDKPSDALDHI